MDNGFWRNRIQTYDVTFALEPKYTLTLCVANLLSPVPSLPGVAVFDDPTTYYDHANPLGSVKHPNTGPQVRITSISALGGFMEVQVCPAE